MNEDKIKSQNIKPEIKSIPGKPIPTSEDHPLHILDNQVDPSKKPRKFDVPQKPIRTYEKDMEEEMARLSAAGTPYKKPKESFFTFKRKEKPQSFDKVTITEDAPKTLEQANDEIKAKKKYSDMRQEMPKYYADKSALNDEENPVYNINNADTLDLKGKKIISQNPIRTYEKDFASAISENPSLNANAGILMEQMRQQSQDSDNTVEDIGKKIDINDLQKEIPQQVVTPRPEKTFEQAVAEAEAKQGIPPERERVVEPEIVKKKPEPVISPIKIPIQIPKPSPVVSPIISPIETQPIEKLEPQSNLRTYEGDVASTIQNKGASVMSVAIAENNRRNIEENDSNITESHTGRNLVMVFASIALILSGIGGIYYLYSKNSHSTVAIKQDTKITNIVSSNSQKILTTVATNRIDLTKFISDQFNSVNAKPGDITEFIINQKLASSTVKLTGPQFINLLGFNITDTLRRSLTDKWMIGTYSVNNQDGVNNFPFIILTTDFFQNAFAGMLKWENTMPDEFADILNYRNKTNSNNNASSTIYTTNGIRGNFKDRIIMNRDVREFINNRGEILFLYSFIDNKTILITTSESVIPAILDRIEKQTYVR